MLQVHGAVAADGDEVGQVIDRTRGLLRVMRSLMVSACFVNSSSSV
mgnify:CR=1 FL=1